MRLQRVTPTSGLSKVVALGLLLTVSLSGYAELTEPRAQDKQIVNLVNFYLRQQHLSRHPMDDEISQRGVKTFLKMLDPLKVYFTKSDIDEFNKKNDIDDMLRDKDISFGYTVYKRYQKRVHEKVKLIESILAEKHDFNVDEEYINKPEKLSYAADEKEARERWRKRIKFDLLVLQGSKVEGEEALKRLKTRYTGFASRIDQTSPDELLEMYLTAITTGFDPHTTYFSPTTLDDFRIRMRLKYQGIGAELETKDSFATIRRIIPGGAAEKQGKLKPKDRIVQVGQGDGGDMVDVVNKKLGDIVQLIRGKADTIVRLGVIPAGETDMKIYKITRAEVQLTDSEARGITFDVGKKKDGSAVKMTVISLPSFYMDMEAARRGEQDYKSTTRDVRKLLDGFVAKKVEVVILDLRQNGGGSLTEAIDLTGLFIDQGPVVQVKDARGRVSNYKDDDKGVAWNGPLVVVTDKFGASASEILAGAIQDYKRGLIVGDNSTHGKGTVQSLIDLGQNLFGRNTNFGALKITMQQFYRPNGESTQKRGVLADIPLPSVSNHMDVSESDLDYALDFDKVPSAEFDAYSMVSPQLLTKLKGASADRRKASSEFTKIRKDVERFKDRKNRDSVPLNEKTYRQQLAGDDKKKKKEKDPNAPKEVVKRDGYFNEVMAIAVDYFNGLGEKRIAQTR